LTRRVDGSGTDVHGDDRVTEIGDRRRRLPASTAELKHAARATAQCSIDTARPLAVDGNDLLVEAPRPFVLLVVERPDPVHD